MGPERRHYTIKPRISIDNLPPPRRKAGGRQPSHRGNFEAEVISSLESPLKLQPILNEEELQRIRQQWERDDLVRKERSVKMDEEELRIQHLLHTPRVKDLIATYEQVRSLSFHGVRLSAFTSTDDVIALLRYAIDKYVVGPEPSEGEKSVRDRILQLERSDAEKMKLQSPLLLYFPSHREALVAAYPALDLQVYEFSKVPQNYWCDPQGKERMMSALRWFIGRTEDPLVFRSQLLSTISQHTLAKFGIGGSIRSCGFRTIADLVSSTYPEFKIQPWELDSMAYWKGDEKDQRIKEAVRWLVEVRFGLSPNDPSFREKLMKLKARHFIDNRLGGMLGSGISSHMAAVILAYEDLGLREEEFNRFPANSWKGPEAKARGLSCVVDLVENKLKLSPKDEDFRSKLLCVQSGDFTHFGLGGMLGTLYNHYAPQAIIEAYPNLHLKEWEFSHVPSNFWQRDGHANVRKAIKWLIEEKLQLNPDEETFKQGLLGVTVKDFTRFRLVGMLRTVKLSLVEVLQLAYPEVTITSEEFSRANTHRRINIVGISSADADEELGRLIQ